MSTRFRGRQNRGFHKRIINEWSAMIMKTINKGYDNIDWLLKPSGGIFLFIGE